MLGGFGAMRRTLVALGDEKPAAVIAAGGERALDLGASLAGWIERPAIWLGFDESEAFPWGKRDALDRYAKIVAQTRRMTIRLVDALGVPEERVATIYPAIDLASYVAPSERAAGEGNLVAVAGRPPDATLAAIQAACRRARLAMPGARPPLADAGPSWTPDALARAALLLLLPDAGWAGAYDDVIKAMACGLPVIAAVPPETLDDDLVVNGETGRVIGAGSPAEIAQAIDDALASPDLLGSMGSGGRLLAASRFDPARRRNEYDALLRIVCGIPFPPPKTRGADAPGIPVQFRGLGRPGGA
jgi:hypothetical protein